MKTKTKIAIPALAAVFALMFVVAAPNVMAAINEPVRDFDGPGHSEMEGTDKDIEYAKDSDGEGHGPEGLDEDVRHVGDSDGVNSSEAITEGSDVDGKGHGPEGLDEGSEGNHENDRD